MKHFLIAEDDTFTRKVLASMLAPFGTVTSVENGTDAVAAFQAAHAEGKPFDLICLDVIMPGLDGRQTLEGIRRAEEKLGIPQAGEATVLMTTAVEDKDVIEQTFVGLRATAYMVKPVRRDDLLAILRDFDLISPDAS